MMRMRSLDAAPRDMEQIGTQIISRKELVADGNHILRVTPEAIEESVVQFESASTPDDERLSSRKARDQSPDRTTLYFKGIAKSTITFNKPAKGGKEQLKQSLGVFALGSKLRPVLED